MIVFCACGCEKCSRKFVVLLQNLVPYPFKCDMSHTFIDYNSFASISEEGE